MGAFEDRIRWNHRYSRAGFSPDWAPDVHLVTRLSDLPGGRALDVACGVGANALFLAKRGWEVHAVDLSDVAIERLRRAASAEGVLKQIRLELADLSTWDFPENAYEVVICTRFLDRSLCSKLVRALVPGGVLYYRSYTMDHLEKKPDFERERLLAPGELQVLFSDLLEMHYEELVEEETVTAAYLGQKPT
ncbi:MAG: class I SAM-dependent methyltransferase [Deltaproteobacteria bacterium]|nr:class I SAM-dependent methyltransferase [Deltaproteobacteria bacterium]